MTGVPKDSLRNVSPDSPTRTDLERRLMALDALAKLTHQFSEQQSFEEAVRQLLWTISGQFSVPSAVAMITDSSTSDRSVFLFGTGKLAHAPHLDDLDLLTECATVFLNSPHPVSTSSLLDIDGAELLASSLSYCGIAIICPLIHGDEFLGILGLGERVGGRQYGEEEFEILHALASTMTPFVVSARLFQEIAGLSRWCSDVIDSVTQGVAIFDSKLCLKSLNSAASDMLRKANPFMKQVTSMIGAPINVVFPQEIFISWVERVRKAMQTNETGFIDNMLVRTDAEEHICSLSIAVTQGKSQSELDTIITVEDITDRKATEERLFELTRLADKGLMVSSIAHELNNFLTMIMCGVQLASSASQRGDDAEFLENMARIEETLGRMQRFTAGLTDFGQMRTTRETRNLNDLVLGVLSFVRVQKRFSRIRILDHLQPDLPATLLDRDQIAQLLLNFLNNSADAIRESSQADGTITVKTDSHDNWVAMVIEDNGNGIPDEIKDKLFEERHTTKPNGHGFGLVTCARIVEGHHGRISMQSELGSGTAITVELPIVVE